MINTNAGFALDNCGFGVFLAKPAVTRLPSMKYAGSHSCTFSNNVVASCYKIRYQNQNQTGGGRYFSIFVYN